MTAEMGFFLFLEGTQGGGYWTPLRRKEITTVIKSFLGRGEELSSEKWTEPAKIISE